MSVGNVDYFARPEWNEFSYFRRSQSDIRKSASSILLEKYLRPSKKDRVLNPQPDGRPPGPDRHALICMWFLYITIASRYFSSLGC